MKPSEIFSIFGQIEGVVALMMIKEGKGRYIEPRAIPSGVMFNAEGQMAQFAIVLPAKHRAEFERRIANLRA